MLKQKVKEAGIKRRVVVAAQMVSIVKQRRTLRVEH